MANREKGEVGIDVNDERYTLVLNTNAMVALEDLFSTPTREVTFDQVLARVNAGSVRHIRGLIWAALTTYHPTITLEQAGTLIQDAGGLMAFAQRIVAMVAGTTVDAEDLKALGVKPGNPQRAQTAARGTGKRSTATRAASV